MRVLVAHCEIGYAGRLVTRLSPGDRVVLFKDDGSVCVHALAGARPVNYMGPPTVVEEDGDVIRVRRIGSGETLTILLHEVHSDLRHVLADDGVGLERDGREKQLHDQLVRAPHLIEQGLVVCEQERPTDVGPIDLFCRDRHGQATLVEVKRVRAGRRRRRAGGPLPRAGGAPPRLPAGAALLVAPDFAPQARVLAESRDVECVRIDVEVLRGEAVPDLKLFDV
jgi:RecB family endonuclease NucS